MLCLYTLQIIRSFRKILIRTVEPCCSEVVGKEENPHYISIHYSRSSPFNLSVTKRSLVDCPSKELIFAFHCLSIGFVNPLMLVEKRQRLPL